MCDLHLFVFFSYNCLISAAGTTPHLSHQKYKISSARFINSIWTSVHRIHIFNIAIICVTTSTKQAFKISFDPNYWQVGFTVTTAVQKRANLHLISMVTGQVSLKLSSSYGVDVLVLTYG